MNFFLDAKNIPSLSPCGSKMLDSSVGGVEGGMDGRTSGNGNTGDSLA